MMTVFPLVLALAGVPQMPASAAPGTFIGAGEVATTLQRSIANNVVDQLVKGADVPGARVSVAVLHRTKAETSALIHDHVTEVYEVMQGSGTLVTGGTLVDPKPNDLTRLGAGMSRSGTHQGGTSQRVGPKDIIIIPAGTPHRFSQLDGDITYLVYRVEPK